MWCLWIFWTSSFPKRWKISSAAKYRRWPWLESTSRLPSPRTSWISTNPFSVRTSSIPLCTGSYFQSVWTQLQSFTNTKRLPLFIPLWIRKSLERNRPYTSVEIFVKENGIFHVSSHCGNNMCTGLERAVEFIFSSFCKFSPMFPFYRHNYDEADGRLDTGIWQCGICSENFRTVSYIFSHFARYIPMYAHDSSNK